MDDKTESLVRDALSELAGIDTHDVNLRDHSKAWEVMAALIAAQRKPLAEALEAADAWISAQTHQDDDCFVSNHYEGDPGNQCRCGKTAVSNYIEMTLLEAGLDPLGVGEQQ